MSDLVLKLRNDSSRSSCVLLLYTQGRKGTDYCLSQEPHPSCGRPLWDTCDHIFVSHEHHCSHRFLFRNFMRCISRWNSMNIHCRTLRLRVLFSRATEYFEKVSVYSRGFCGNVAVSECYTFLCCWHIISFHDMMLLTSQMKPDFPIISSFRIDLLNLTAYFFTFAALT